MLIKTPKKNPKKYICESCSFECRNKKDYTRHLSTTKHNRLINANGWLMEKTPDDKSSKNVNIGITSLPTVSNNESVNNGVKPKEHFECDGCGRVYSHLSSLYKHKKICFNNEVVTNEMVTTQLATLSKEI